MPPARPLRLENRLGRTKIPLHQGNPEKPGAYVPGFGIKGGKGALFLCVDRDVFHSTRSFFLIQQKAAVIERQCGKRSWIFPGNLPCKIIQSRGNTSFFGFSVDNIRKVWYDEENYRKGGAGYEKKKRIVDYTKRNAFCPGPAALRSCHFSAPLC